MKLNIITNIDNGKGLQRDYYLLRDYFLARGHEVVGLQFDNILHQMSGPAADVNIFCETVAPEFFNLAPRNLVFVNPEWWVPEYDKHLPKIDALLCKTRDAEREFAPTGKVVFTGFISENRYIPKIERKRRFLHVAGGSKVRNTEAVLQAWATFGIPAEVVVVAQHYPTAAGIPNVIWYPYIGLAEMIQLQNECMFHLCTSAYEGYGQSLRESMSTRNAVIVTDAPPMNEVNTITYLKVPVSSSRKFRRGTLSYIDAAALRDVAMKAVAMGANAINQAGGRVHKQWREEQDEFDVTMTEVLG